MRPVDGRSLATMVVLTYCGLASSLFFAFAGYSRFSGLQYHIGYDIRPLDFFILSSSVDPLVWLSSTATTTASALAIAFRQTGRERLVYTLFVLSEAIQLTLFLSGQQSAAFQLSLATGVVLVSLAVVLPRRFRSVTQSEGALLTCAGFLALAVLVESLALLSRVLSTLQESFLEIPSLLQAAIVQTQLSDSPFVTSPALMLIMLFSWVPLLPFLLRRKCAGSEPSTSPRRERIGTEMISSFALLGIAMVVGVFVTISPHLTHRGLLGVDTPYYYGRLASMKTLGDVVYIFGVDWHPLYLALLYFIRMTTGWDNIQVIIAGPGLLAALFALANYLLAKEVTASHLASGIAALFAASWLHTTIGLFAGIYANWLAMVFVVFFLFCLVRTLRDGGKLSVIGAIAFAYMTALSHIWTWAVLIASLWLGSLLLVLDYLHRRETQRDHKAFKRLAAILVVVTLPPLVLSLTLPGFNSFLFSPGNTFYGIAEGMRPDRINQAWFLISFTLTKYVGGLLTYPLAIVLAFAGAIFVVKSSPGISRLLIGWLVVTSIAAIMLDSWYQWRALYVIPFEIFAASAMMGILDTLDRIGNRDRVSTGSSFFLVKCLKGLFVVLIILDSVNYAIMAASNLPPS